MKLYTGTRMVLIAGGWLFALLRAEAAETSLIEFELESHDRQDYTRSSWAGRPLMLFVSTREAAVHNTGLAWSNPIAAAITASLADVMLVKVSTLPAGVPRLFAGMVRDAVAPTAEDPIRVALLDWENLFARSYELGGDDYNVLLFDRSGKLVYSVTLEAFGQNRLDTVLRELRAAAESL